MYQHILLPTDGSELSERAIRSGIRLAKSLGARVTGLYVIEESSVAAGIGKALGDEGKPEDVAKAFLAVVTNEARKAGVPSECFHVTGGSPSEQVIHAAQSKGCDLIFMATHGQEKVTGMVLGSHTVRVLTHSRIPVLVYR